MNKCELCGTNDLLLDCNMSKCCSVCTMRFFGGGDPTSEQLANFRARLGLKPGEMYQQDVGEEAAKILGRKKPR